MKVLLFILYSLLFLNGKTYSQITLGSVFGYGIGWATDGLSEGNIINLGNGIQDRTTVNYSLGDGQSYSSFLYIKYNLYVECGGQFIYILSSPVDRSIKSPSTEALITHRGKVFWVVPSVKLTVPHNRFAPYIHFGIGAGLFSTISIKQALKTNNQFIEKRIVLSEGTPFCILSGLGFRYAFTRQNRWWFLFELSSINATYAPHRSEVIQSRENGVDNLASLSVDHRIVEYKKKYVWNINDPGDPNQPSIGQRTYFPFSRFGLNIGLLLKL